MLLLLFFFLTVRDSSNPRPKNQSVLSCVKIAILYIQGWHAMWYFVEENQGV